MLQPWQPYIRECLYRFKKFVFEFIFVTFFFLARVFLFLLNEKDFRYGSNPFLILCTQNSQENMYAEQDLQIGIFLFFRYIFCMLFTELYSLKCMYKGIKYGVECVVFVIKYLIFFLYENSTSIYTAGFLCLCIFIIISPRTSQRASLLEIFFNTYI